MAHSNRSKLREGRGGKTKHQAMKSAMGARNKSTFDAQARIKELAAYMDSLTQKKEAVVAGAPRAKTWSKTRSAVERRKVALETLLVRVEDKGLTEVNKARIEAEIATLRKRI